MFIFYPWGFPGGTFHMGCFLKLKKEKRTSEESSLKRSTAFSCVTAHWGRAPENRESCGSFIPCNLIMTDQGCHLVCGVPVDYLWLLRWEWGGKGKTKFWPTLLLKSLVNNIIILQTMTTIKVISFSRYLHTWHTYQKDKLGCGYS